MSKRDALYNVYINVGSQL